MEEELFIFIIFLMSLFISSLFFFLLQFKPFLCCFRVYPVLPSPATAPNILLVAGKKITERNLESAICASSLKLLSIRPFVDNSLLRYIYIYFFFPLGGDQPKT